MDTAAAALRHDAQAGNGPSQLRGDSHKEAAALKIGDSTKQFSHRPLGCSPPGGGTRRLHHVSARQMGGPCRLPASPSACRAQGKVVTVDAKPIKRFEAWLQHDDSQANASGRAVPRAYRRISMRRWPRTPSRSTYRAISALKHSALGPRYLYLAGSSSSCRIDQAAGGSS